MDNKKLTLDDFNKYVDSLLEMYFLHESINREILGQFTGDHKDLVDKQSVEQVLSKMEHRLGLVKKTPDDFRETWILTEFGQRVLQHGNWTKYLYNAEKLISDNLKSSIETNADIRDTNKTTRLISRIALATGIVTVLITASNLLIDCKSLRLQEQEHTNKEKLNRDSQTQVPLQDCVKMLLDTLDVTIVSTDSLYSKADSLDKGVK